MKKLMCLIMTFVLFGCSSTPSSPSETPIASNNNIAPTTQPTQAPLPLLDSLPLASIGIFNDKTELNTYAIVTTNVYRNHDEYNTINIDPLYEFVKANEDLMEFIPYYGKYDPRDGVMLAEMGLTPQSLKDYNLDYYFRFYKINPTIKDQFLEVVHSLSAKYGSRIEEGDEIPIHFVEKTIEFKEYGETNPGFEPIPVSFNEDGYNYYLVNEAESVYMKITEDLNESFFVGKDNNLYGIFFDAQFYTGCMWGNYVSTNAFTDHGEVGGFSVIAQQLSENLRIAQFHNFAVPEVSDPTVQHAIDTFDYESASLVVK